MRAFEAIAEEISRQGVREIFTYMSRDIIKLVAELAKPERGVTVYQSHHEHTAVGMADGYARTTGRPGVVFIGAGVGLTNALNALITAAKAHTGILVFVGEVPGGGLGTATAKLAHKYVDQRGVLDKLGIRHIDLKCPKSCHADIRACLELAQHGGEALVVSLPFEVLEAETSDGPSIPDVATCPPAAGLSPPDREMLSELLREPSAASRTVILAGRGAVSADAKADLMRLGTATGALLGTSVMAREYFQQSPYSIGVVGTFSSGIAAELLAQASLVVTFGASLNYYTSYVGEIFGKARIIHIDSKPAAIGKFQPVDLGIVADARLAAAALADDLEQRHHVAEGYRTPETESRIRQFGRRETPPDSASAHGLDPRSVLAELDRILPPDRIVVVDVGNFMDFAVAHLGVASPRDFVWPVEYSAVGSGLGPALGAAVAHPDRLTVLCIGDGGMVMSLADLHTAVRYRLRLLVVICNDSALGGELHFLRECGYDDGITRSVNPPFEALAKSIGLEAATVTTLDDLSLLQDRLRRLDGPMLVDCRVTHELAPDSRNILGSLVRKGVA